MPDVFPIVLDGGGKKKRQYDPLTDTIPGAGDHQNGFFRVKEGEKITVQACRQSVTLGGMLSMDVGGTLCILGQYRLRF